MPEHTDIQLVEASLSGDQKSLELLFKRYLRPIYGYAAGLVGRDEADDVVQETFVRAWRHLSSFDTKRVFKTWLYRIAHNAAVDLLNKKRPTAFSDLDRPDDSASFEESIEDETDPISELLDRQDAAAHLRRALDALPVKQRTVLSLHYLDDLTFGEIGELLDEPLDTVKSRARRSLATLKKLLEA